MPENNKQSKKYDINESPFFVMIHLVNGAGNLVALPMTDEEDRICLFDTMELAIEAGKSNHAGSHFGFEVFEHGCGEYNG